MYDLSYCVEVSYQRSQSYIANESRAVLVMRRSRVDVDVQAAA